MYTVHTQRISRKSVGTKRQLAMAIGLVLIAVTTHSGSAQAGDPGNAQLAKKPTAGESELSDGFDLSFDEKAVIGDNAVADASTSTVKAWAGERNDARLTFKGVHKLTISLYPDDYRPSATSGPRDP